MSYSVEIIADSIAPHGKRITTFQCTYPRIIHAELKTNRAFSTNSASSRAIPIERMIKWVRERRFYPIHWGSAKKGMQAGAEIENVDVARRLWDEAFDNMNGIVDRLNLLGLHKQIPNRLLEPFSYITTCITATEFDNFFGLRCHSDAQPEIQRLAVLMARAIRDNKPRLLDLTGKYKTYEQWHLPYVLDSEFHEYNIMKLIKFSVARCARTSYKTFEGKPPKPEDDIDLYNKLINSEPRHMSPCEHVACPHSDENYRSGNFVGYIQYRKTIENECIQKFDYSILDKFNEQGFLLK
jgi:hypothetical protein